MKSRESEVIVSSVKIPLGGGDGDAMEKAKRTLSRIPGVDNVTDLSVYKKSVDARKKNNITLVYSVSARCRVTDGGLERLKENFVRIRNTAPFKVEPGSEPQRGRTVVVGFGPAGMFASLLLAEMGYRPLVLERGADVDKRCRAVEIFKNGGPLDTENNVQFGAGGAGTFSDGKLTTRIGDPLTSKVLDTFLEMGAPSDVVTKAKPHIGTDVLRDVVKNFDRRIKELGGEIRYNTAVTSVDTGRVVTEDGAIDASAVILAIGHSARDLYSTLFKSGFAMEAKPFSVGVRIEHLQRDIDRAMYGDEALSEILGHAEYSLSRRRGDRGVYSFCMCPGGEVVTAASETGGVVTNGMSNRKRDGKNANAAIAVSVLKDDFGGDPMRAIEFQRSLERAAFVAGGGDYSAPVQSFGRFLDGRAGFDIGDVSPTYGGGRVAGAELSSLLPDFVTSMLREGIAAFGGEIKGFDGERIPLTGFETRTSAPLRILRGEDLCALGHDGIYPCGEGAGYAGGIVSAAVDGIRAASAVIRRFAPADR